MFEQHGFSNGRSRRGPRIPRRLIDLFLLVLILFCQTGQPALHCNMSLLWQNLQWRFCTKKRLPMTCSRCYIAATSPNMLWALGQFPHRLRFPEVVTKSEYLQGFCFQNGATTFNMFEHFLFQTRKLEETSNLHTTLPNPSRKQRTLRNSDELF